MDQLHLTGGTICLGPGDFNLGNTPVELKGAVGVRIRGQGSATVFIQPKAEAAFIISQQSQLCTLDYLTIRAATDGTSGPAIHLSNSTGTTIERVRITGTAADAPTRTAILLEGDLGQTRIRDSYLSAPFGLAEQGNLLLDGFDCEDNTMECSDTGIRLGGYPGQGHIINFGNQNSPMSRDSVIARNRISLTRAAGISLTGIASTGLAVTCNSITPLSGDGIIIGVGCSIVSEAGAGGDVCISDNRVASGPNGFMNHAIRVAPGASQVLLNNIAIRGNQLEGVEGSESALIQIETPIDSALVEGNIFIDLAGSGLTENGILMLAGSSAKSLAISGNRFDGLVNGIVIRSHVVSAFVGGNIFNAITGTGLAMGLGSSSDHLVISGNRFDDVKVDGIAILTHVVSAFVEGNTFNAIARFALAMPFPGGSADRLEVLANEIFGSSIFLRQVSEGVISDNAINAGSLPDAGVRVDSSGSIRFSDNTITTTVPGVSVTLQATTLIVSANRVRCDANTVALGLDAAIASCVVLGNVVTGKIQIKGVDLGPPWLQFNVIGL